jgi:phage shock protein E
MKKSVVLFSLLILIIGGFIVNPFSSSDPKKLDITTEEFKQKLKEERGIIVDVRTKDEYNNGHLADTDFQYDFLNGEFQEKIEDMDKEKTYYLYCRTGNRSGKAARIMQEKGFKNVYNIGGFEDLANAGFESENSYE